MDVICDTFDATMCQKKTQSRKHRQRFWSRIDRKRRGPRLMILGMILCGCSSNRGYFLPRRLCTTGHARHAPSIQFKSTSFKPSLSFSRRYRSIWSTVNGSIRFFRSFNRFAEHSKSFVDFLYAFIN